ncbi:hypothetical protein NTGHW29_930011 [Candidatus Nitrotoga sp. HW29]|nr:hypothetical protein NTGHW29_930011 [Candidatus Nitrotoga sp. HW29]
MERYSEWQKLFAFMLITNQKHGATANGIHDTKSFQNELLEDRYRFYG